jgi:superfamily II DNA or RNA helicase
MAIIDECHHVSKEKSQYGTILQNCLAPLKLGITATPPTDTYGKLVNEGLIGPILTEVSNTKAIDQGILAKPIIKLIPVEHCSSIASKSGNNYQKFRLHGITRNKNRNNLIIKEAIQSIRNKQITLIIVENIEHGKILQDLFRDRNLRVPFVEGQMKIDSRLEIKQQLELSKLKTAISSKAWREGISIKSLNKIIYAAGLSEEKLIKQAVGRGQNANGNKTTVEFVDFLDCYKFLSEHCIKRIATYYKEGWLK